MKYPFQTLLLVCTGERCNDEGRGKERGEVIRQELKDHNKKMGRKGAVRICSVSCLDLCDYGPNLIVEPGGDVYSHLSRGSARRVYDGAVGDGAQATDLLLDPDEFKR